MRKHGPKTWSKNDGLGIHFGSQNRWKSMPERQKSAQIVKTCRFWKVPFFHRFFNAFFDEFWVSWASPGSVQNRLFRYFFRLFCSPVASELLLGSPGTVSGQFFIDFWLILARFWLDFLSYFLSICCRSVAHLGPILDCFFARARFQMFFLTAFAKKKLWLGDQGEVQWMNEWMNEWMKLY